MMASYDISEAERDFASLIDRALTGEDVVITVGGEPKVRIVPIDTELPEPEQDA